MGKPGSRQGAGDAESDADVDARIEAVAQAAADEADQRAVEEIEALEEDLERANQRADGLQTELEATRAELTEAHATAEKAEDRITQLERKSGSKQGGREAAGDDEGRLVEEIDVLEADLKRSTDRADRLQSELETVREELETLRNEIVDRVREVVGGTTTGGSTAMSLTQRPSASLGGGAPARRHETMREHVDRPLAPSATRRRRRFGWPLGVIVGAVSAAGIAGLIAGTTTAGSEPPPPPLRSSEPGVDRYERALGDQFAALDETRDSQLKRLHKAEGAGEQAAAAGRMASAHARAARALAPELAPAQLRPSKGAIVSALHEVADAYRKVEAAAGTRQPVAYEHAAADVRKAEKELRRGLKTNSKAVVE
jgi:hypothetical protein